MNLLNKLTVAALLGIVLVGGAFAQKLPMSRSVARQTPRAYTAGKISAENVNNYFVGYDFDLVARYMKDDDKFRDSLAQMTILWDELYQQPEATDIEALMRMTTRGQGTLDLKLARLEKAKASVEKRLTGEARWYYNVGFAYSALFTAMNGKDFDGFKKQLGTLGTLGASAPTGTPSNFVSALNSIGSFSNKSQFTDADIAVLEKQCDAVSDIISA